MTRAVARAIGAAGYWMLEPVLLLIGLLAGALVSVGNWFSDLMGGGNLEGLIEAQRRLDEFHQTLRETETEPGGSGWFTALKWGAAAIGMAARHVDRLRTFPLPSPTRKGKRGYREPRVAVQPGACRG